MFTGVLGYNPFDVWLDGWLTSCFSMFVCVCIFLIQTYSLLQALRRRNRHVSNGYDADQDTEGDTTGDEANIDEDESYARKIRERNANFIRPRFRTWYFAYDTTDTDSHIDGSDKDKDEDAGCDVGVSPQLAENRRQDDNCDATPDTFKSHDNTSSSGTERPKKASINTEIPKKAFISIERPEKASGGTKEQKKASSGTVGSMKTRLKIRRK